MAELKRREDQLTTADLAGRTEESRREVHDIHDIEEPKPAAVGAKGRCRAESCGRRLRHGRTAKAADSGRTANRSSGCGFARQSATGC